MNRILGKPVIITQGIPKMQCTPEFNKVQSPELVASLNQWYADFFGYTELIPRGQVMHDRINDVFVMSQSTWAEYQAIQSHGFNAAYVAPRAG